jgi:riboflavin synthase
MGGHMVSGHVDGLGEVVAIRPEARSTRYQVRAPGSLLKYIAAKGSITVDGVSLTVNAVAGDSFDLNIIPHTAGVTSISTWRVGTRVNLEVDLLARYLERLLKFDDEAVPDAQPALSLERLRKAGFTGEP